LIAFQ